MKYFQWPSRDSFLCRKGSAIARCHDSIFHHFVLSRPFVWSLSKQTSSVFLFPICSYEAEVYTRSICSLCLLKQNYTVCLVHMLCYTCFRTYISLLMEKIYIYLSITMFCIQIHAAFYIYLNCPVYERFSIAYFKFEK